MRMSRNFTFVVAFLVSGFYSFQACCVAADTVSGQSKCQLLLCGRFVKERKFGFKADDYRYLQFRIVTALNDDLPPLDGRLIEIAIGAQNIPNSPLSSSGKQIPKNSLWIIDIPDVTAKRNQFLLVNQSDGLLLFRPETLKKFVELKLSTKEQRNACFRKVKELGLLD